LKAWEQFEGCLKSFGTALGMLEKLGNSLRDARKTWEQLEGCLKNFRTG